MVRGGSLSRIPQCGQGWSTNLESPSEELGCGCLAKLGLLSTEEIGKHHFPRASRCCLLVESFVFYMVEQ